MKTIAKRLLSAGLVLALLLSSAAMADDHFALRGRGQGPIKYFTGNVEIIVIFVSTPSHPWTEKKKNEVYQVSNSSVSIMKKQAKRYKAKLDLCYGWLEYKIPMEYNKDQKWYHYILNNIYNETSIAQVYRRYERDLGKDSTPIMFMFNSWDTSYTYVCSTDYPGWNEEYCVIFCDTKMHDNYLTHEVLHQYGAIDLYDYNGEGIERVAKKYFPDSDMLTVSHVVDELTAYLIGWTSKPSSKAQKFMNETRGKREKR